jgi:DNA repair exonuclease SbcCD ATPase subunit
MSFIRRIADSVPIVVLQPSTSEEVPQKLQTQGSLGIAGTADLFEATSTNHFTVSEEPMMVTQKESNTNMVEASSMFSVFERNEQFDNRLPELNEKLKMLEERKRELVTERESYSAKEDQLRKTKDAVKEAIDSDKPIPDEVVALVGSLGIFGIIGGLPAIPILAGLGAFLGLTGNYRAKAQQVHSELERQEADCAAQTEQCDADLQKIDKQIESANSAIEKEKERLERLAQPMQEKIYNSRMVVEPMWQEFQPHQDVVQNEENSVSIKASPILNKGESND